MNHLLFCYGSLVNKSSRLRTVKRKSKGLPVRLSKMAGFSRNWSLHTICKCPDHPDRQHTVLALNKNKRKNTTINGLLIEISDKELEDIDKREERYKRITLPIKYFTFLDKNKSHKKILKNYKLVNVYISNSINKPTKKYPIRLRYLSLCIDGFLEYGQEFNEEFLRTTHN